MSIRTLVGVQNSPQPINSPILARFLEDEQKPMWKRVMDLAFSHSLLYLKQNDETRELSARNDPAVAVLREMALEQIASAWDQVEQIVFADPQCPLMRRERFDQCRAVALRFWIAKPTNEFLN